MKNKWVAQTKVSERGFYYLLVAVGQTEEPTVPTGWPKRRSRSPRPSGPLFLAVSVHTFVLHPFLTFATAALVVDPAAVHLITAGCS